MIKTIGRFGFDCFLLMARLMDGENPGKSPVNQNFISLKLDLTDL